MISKSFQMLIGAAWIATFMSNTVAQDLSGFEIMQMVDDAQRQTNDSSFNRMQLSSCKFGVTEGRITCAERPRVKALESVAKSYGVDLKDTKSITITLEPEE